MQKLGHLATRAVAIPNTPGAFKLDAIEIIQEKWRNVLGKSAAEHEVK
ncbi:MAG: hypothetical protein ABI830_06220 [Pseudolabrys sp.]